MRKFWTFLLLCLFSTLAYPARATEPPRGGDPGWRARLGKEMPLLGHRNWIIVVDSAYPLQSSPGVETLETGAPELEVIGTVLGAVRHSQHVRPVLSMDAELAYLTEADAPGVSAFRAHLAKLLSGAAVSTLPHEQLIEAVDRAGARFHVLVLKTTATIPYSSLFLRLDCRYWSDEAEQRLRRTIDASPNRTAR